MDGSWSLPVECIETVRGYASFQSDTSKEEDLQLEEYIGKWLKRRENSHAPKSYYLKWQPFITPRTRAILVDWMIEAAAEFKLHRDTTHMAINYVDRFLSVHPTLPKDKLQLVAVASLLLASKIEVQKGGKVPAE